MSSGILSWNLGSSPANYILIAFDSRKFDSSVCFFCSGEKALQNLIDSDKSPTGEHSNVDNIKNIVTAKNLCSCRDPISMAFDVSAFN